MAAQTISQRKEPDPIPQIFEKAFIEVTTHILEKEIGTPDYRLFLADRVDRLKEKHEIPNQVTIQDMSDRLK